MQHATDADWWEDALCAQTDPDAFFPEWGSNSADAKRVCTDCDVQAQCLAYALANNEGFGVWGGLSTNERNRLKKAKNNKAPTRSRKARRDRNAEIIALADHNVEINTIAARLRVTARTVHRVIANHRDAPAANQLAS